MIGNNHLAEQLKVKMKRVQSSQCLNASKQKLDDGYRLTAINHPMVSANHFEDLPNELILNIFDFLDGYHIFEAFSNLNNRFKHLINSPYFFLKLNISFMSKSNFNNRLINIIRPYINRIISLQLSLPFYIKNFFQSFPIDRSSFSRLESLVLNDLNVNVDVSILNSLTQLPRLFSLKIFCFKCNELYIIFQSIFRLPVLKYVKLLFSDWDATLPFPLATSDNQRSMTLEYLAVDGSFDLGIIYRLISYTPRLRRLSAKGLMSDGNIPIEQFIVSRNLTSICLRDWYLSFAKLASFIAIVGSQLESLRISIKHKTALSNAYQWQQLILRHMPRLRTFLFDYHDPFIKDADRNNSCRTLLDQFSSPFWIERGWFFAHRHYHHRFSQKIPSLAFYSTQLRWRNFWQNNAFFDDNICSYQDPLFNLFIRPRIRIKSENVVANFPFQFPRVTELELSVSHTIDINSFIGNLNDIIILTNITYLIISFDDPWLNSFIKLLNRMPHVQKLVLGVHSSSQMEMTSDQQANNIDFVCNNNVRDVKIIGSLALAIVQLLNKLFPQMERLQIKNSQKSLISSVRTLLSNRINNSHLFSLVFYDAYDAMIKQLKTMIDSEKLIDNYDIEQRRFKLCLWW